MQQQSAKKHCGEQKSQNSHGLIVGRKNISIVKILIKDTRDDYITFI